MTSRVFGLRAAQFSGLFQPAPAQRVTAIECFAARQQRVGAPPAPLALNSSPTAASLTCGKYRFADDQCRH